jgi:Protein of unknown function (DUF1559)
MSRRTWAVLGLVVLVVSCGLLLPYTVIKISNREAWMHSANNLRQIGLALQSYHEVHGKLPPAVVRDKEGRPLYSWRVLLLPFLEQQRLYEQFKLDEPWDSPHNQRLLGETPRCYSQFGLGNDVPPGQTRYQVFVGPGTAFERPGLSWKDFPDGLANTLLVVEAGEAVPWTKPADLAYDPDGPPPPLGGAFTRPVRFLWYEVARRPGFTACFSDGMVGFLPIGMDENTLRGLIKRNGGERVDR